MPSTRGPKVIGRASDLPSGVVSVKVHEYEEQAGIHCSDSITRIPQ